jgi:3-deoxy-D-manno-octulosonic-acid transferase
MVELLYALAAHLLRAVAWPTLWWLGRRAPGFRQRWDERRARAPFPAAFRGGLVVHAVSMGEVVAATPLVEGLLAARPDLPLTFTCTTPTASALIVERFGARVHHRYLPFDTPGAVRRFLDQAAPRLLLVMETELWPALLRQAQARGTAVVVAGGRLSERSARRYARWPALTGPLLAAVDLLLVQDAAARARFLALGAAPSRVLVTGSPKFDTAPPAGAEALQARFRAMTAGRTVWLAASTHEGEEGALLDALATLRARRPALLLVLVPRHPQRFDAVAALLDARGLRWQRRSALADGQACDADTDVLLGDTMGELHAWYGAAALAFVGGTLVERGGHSPLEAMAVGTPVLSGPHVFNFAEVFGALQMAAAAQRVAAAGNWRRRWRRCWPTRPQHVRWASAPRPGTRRSAAPARAAWRRSSACSTACRRCRTDATAPGHCAPTSIAAATPHRPACRPRPGRRASGSAAAAAARRGSCATATPRRCCAATGAAARLRRVLGDRFWHRPAPRTRPFAEFALLRRLRAWGLPVPRPLLAGVRRSGWVDRGQILVERIDGAEDLWHRLQRGPLDAAAWARLGAVVGCLHAAGVDHRDLNCRNLMVDGRSGAGADADGRAWIVDFDRCRARPTGAWIEANLARLRRSLRKETALAAAAGLPWHWDEARDWAPLLQAHRALLQAARADAGAASAATAASAAGATDGAVTSTTAADAGLAEGLRQAAPSDPPT